METRGCGLLAIRFRKFPEFIHGASSSVRQEWSEEQWVGDDNDDVPRGAGRSDAPTVFVRFGSW